MISLKKYRGIAGLLMLLLGCTALFWGAIAHPVMKFTREENNSIVKFDSLNEEIAKDLPTPPDGIEFTKTLQLGIDHSKPIHGRLLVAYYSINSNTNITDGEILLYYQTIPKLRGWEVSEDYRSSGFPQIEFKKGAACILIDILFQEYEITMWHDYLNQSFSPTLPDGWLLEILDLGKTDIWTCPYEF